MRAATCAGCGSPLALNQRKWCSERCRKASYGDPCIDCGARTCYGAENARVPEPRCSSCSNEHSRIWTPERVIERIQAWDFIYGDPPALPDWSVYRALEVLHDPARAERFTSGHWPSANSAIRCFGTWNAAIRAAGFTPRAPHGGGGNQYRNRRNAPQVSA